MFSEQRDDGGRDGSDHHGHELCHGSDGDVRRYGGDERSGGERTQITATTPAGTAGAATVTVTVSGQSGSLANGFTYVAPPTVSSVSPNSGRRRAGQQLRSRGPTLPQERR